MAKGFIGASGYKAHLGNIKLKAGYIGTTRVYSAGSTVTYIIDPGVSYTEEVDSGASCLLPKTFTPSKNGWTFVGWRADTAANGTVLTNQVMGDDPITLYAIFAQTISITYYNASTTASKTTGTRYYNGNGNVVNPTFTIVPASLNGWSFNGWATSSEATATIVYSSISNTTFSASTTVYGRYSQTVTLSYNGNGNSGGTMAAQTGIRYYNSGNYSNPSFTLSQNAFTKNAYTFSRWALGSAAGTKYTAGTTITIATNTTMYAVWITTEYTLSRSGVIDDYYTSNHLNSNSIVTLGTIDSSLYKSIHISYDQLIAVEDWRLYGYNFGFGAMDSSGNVVSKQVLYYVHIDAQSNAHNYGVSSGEVTLNLPDSGNLTLFIGVMEDSSPGHGKWFAIIKSNATLVAR